MAEIEYLRKFMVAQGVSGDEGEIASLIAKEIAPYVDEVYTDAMGSLIAHKKGRKGAKKLMFAAHMDEIGFMVNYITDEGYLRVSKMGGINFTAASFSHVVFKNGMRGVIVPEARTAVQNYSPEKVYVDIGAKDKKDAEKRVKIGDTCSVASALYHLAGSRVCGRPIDNRIGCYMLYEVAKRLNKCENDTYFVFTCQEEVGVRGAKTSAYAIAPDYGCAVDIGGSGDVINAAPFAVVLGKGPAIKIKDGMVICHRDVVDLMKKIADDKKIKYQLEILESGGTDTCMLQQARGGCKAGAISVPTRYGHSEVETIDMKDVEGGIEIMKGICETVLA